MKTETAIIATILLFILAYVFDQLAGPVILNVNNPIVFFSPSSLSTYPFTAVAIIVRAIAMVMSLVISSVIVAKKWLLKAGVFFGVATLAELYAIQQLVTKSQVTTTQWTLSIALAAFFLLAPIIFFIIRGLIDLLYNTITKNNDVSYQDETNSVFRELNR
jgi:UTP-glucose-1-phosphate uridylyltransferase